MPLVALSVFWGWNSSAVLVRDAVIFAPSIECHGGTMKLIMV